MEYQLFFDVAVTLIGAMGGWILKAIWEAIKDLQRKDDALKDELHQVHNLVAGEYVKRCDLDNHMNSIFEVLRRIEDRLNDKVDKK